MMRDALRFLGLLALVCCVMGAGIAIIYSVCKERIAAKDRSVLLESIDAVKPEGSSVDVGDVIKVGAEADEIVYIARDSDGRAVGYIAQGGAQGYSSIVRVMVGVRAEDLSIVKVVVLSQQETPGLGANVEAQKSNLTLWEKLFGSEKAEECCNPFLKRFEGKGDEDVDDVDGITAATITSNATKAAIHQAIERIKKAVNKGN